MNSFARDWQVVTAYVRAAERAKIKKGRPDVSLVTRRTDRCEGMGDTWGGGGVPRPNEDVWHAMLTRHGRAGQWVSGYESLGE